MSKNIGNILSGIYNYAVQDKVVHNKAVIKNTFQVNDVITGSVSGASCTIPIINQLHTTISDRIYFQEAEEEELIDLLPYITFELVSSDTFSYYTGQYETFVLSFMAYSDQASSTQITTIDKQLNDLFNKDTELIITDWKFHSLMKRGMSRFFRDENKIWILINNFEIIVQ